MASPQEPPVEETGSTTATPAAAAHAEELGVDLAQVVGSGKDGTITKADVAAVAALSETAAPDDAHAVTVVAAPEPLTGLGALYACARHPIAVTRADVERMRRDGSLYEGVNDSGLPFGPRIQEFAQALNNLRIEVIDR